LPLIKSWLFGALCCLVLSTLNQASASELTQQQLADIGQKIYRNETGGNAKYLISWNDGEDFVSLGIGHFIWFPQGLESPFTESFPSLLAFLKSNNVQFPDWLTPDTDCPWQSKGEFTAAIGQPKMQALRHLLENTFDLQVAFIRQRQLAALPKMVDQVESHSQKKHIESVFYALSTSPAGSYALIDYVNFKGEGTSSKERYQGQGWGLLQVLTAMPETSSSTSNSAEQMLIEFSRACDHVLTQRVALSPQQQKEKRWLAGWRKRCATYSHYATTP
jgi:hypothetical protein